MKHLIIGHTDNIGNYHFNENLSLNRAKAVCDYLIEQGVHHDRLKFEGKGSKQPLANNDSEIGRQKNRRVEIKIIKK